MERFKNLWILLLGFVVGVFIWSSYKPYDRLTWYLEVTPAILGLIGLIVVFPKFKFTNFTLVLIAIHMSILIIGGKYTYAKMPLFEEIKYIFNLQRNYYDRLGHFAQGFIPALIIREVFLRCKVICKKKKKWIFTIIISMCLAISALYEIIEFIVANILGKEAEAFLGTQGSLWDTQWDMTFAFIGGIVALLFFSKMQDKAIKNFEFYEENIK